MKFRWAIFPVILWLLAGSALAADETVCKSRTEVRPEYPDIARKLNVYGVVRVQLSVTATGSVSNAKVLGGNPMLASSAIQAAKSAKWDPAPGTCVASFQFHP